MKIGSSTLAVVPVVNRLVRFRWLLTLAAVCHKTIGEQERERERGRKKKKEMKGMRPKLV